MEKKSLTQQQFKEEKLQQLWKIEKLFQEKKKKMSKTLCNDKDEKQKKNTPKVIGRQQQQQHHQMQTLITIKTKSLIFSRFSFFINFHFFVSLNYNTMMMELALITNSPSVD